MYVAFLSYFLSHSRAASAALSVVTLPEAVLHDENEEKQQAADHGGDTKAEERSGDVILKAVDAALAGAAGGRVLGPVEGGDIANAGAVILVFVPLDPVHQTREVGLIPEALREGAELLCRIGGLRCIFDAVLVGVDSAGRCRHDRVSASREVAEEGPVNVSVGRCSASFTDAVTGAHVFVDLDGLVDVEAVRDCLLSGGARAVG